MIRSKLCVLRRMLWTALSVTTVVFITVFGSLSPVSAAKKIAGRSFEIPAWTFDRGNANVDPNPFMYADYRDNYPELVITDGECSPWVVEYDIDFPVDASYTLNIRYASDLPRPLQLWLDDRLVGTCCAAATTNSGPHQYNTHNPFFRPEKTRPVRVGARWETSAELPVSKGKHTLKLTRASGPVPNLLCLRLVSDVPFPRGWIPDGLGVTVPDGRKQRTHSSLSQVPAEHLAKINRLPAPYRTAFLPPGSVNTASMKLAIKDTLQDFGSQYPDGSRFLDQLNSLSAKHADSPTGTVSEKQSSAIDSSLLSLRSRAMLSHPLLNFDKLLFVKRITYTSCHIYSDHQCANIMGGNLCILSPVSADGTVTDLVPELAGGLFGGFDLSFDAEKVVFSYKKTPDAGFRIYEIGIDGSGLRQLTFDSDEEAQLQKIHGWDFRFEDCDPCYLPDGKIAFVSSRSRRWVFCHPSRVTTLYAMDADGGNMHCLSAGPITELSPTVMDDGRLLYTRWEYVDKGFGNVQSLWSMHPDGSHSTHVYKNDLVLPAGLIDARVIPGSQRIVTIGAPHCGLSVGPVIVLDTRLDRRTPVGMNNITPELGYPGMSIHPSSRTFGYFKDPYPLSEKCFLVSFNPSARDHEPKGYGLYVLDAWGNRTELYRDPDFSCFQATPLRPRPTPMDILPVADADQTDMSQPATMFMHDVYQGMTGIERGRVKYVRVMEAIGVSWEDNWRSHLQADGAGLQASAVGLECDVNIKKNHGIATVYNDGSAHFTVPTEKNLFFQALDENYMELQRMRTFVNLMPGEKRSCIGCHERRQLAPGMGAQLPLAMARPAESLRPQPGDAGPRTIHYARDIRPILDKHCISCHSGGTPQGDLDLSGKLTKLFDISYENFIEKGLVAHLNDGTGASNVAPEPPLTFGSHQSRLIRKISAPPCKANLSREEFIRIVTWIDANCPYFGTHQGKKNIKWKDDSDFRPMPPPVKPTKKGKYVYQ